MYAGVLGAASVEKPSFSPDAGTYNGSVKVKLSTSTSNATIRYTTDGSTPDEKSAKYIGALTITQTTTIKAKAFKSGNSSSTASAKYKIEKSARTATISATTPIIPKGSALKGDKATKRCVMYQAELTGTVTAGSTPQEGVQLRFQSDRGESDTITQPSKPTNSGGKVTGRITTYAQGTSKITDDTSDIATPSPAAISFGKADWAAKFWITGYVIANEADFTGSTVTNPCGLTGTWRRNFLYGSGVKMQGSGQDLKGQIITIDWTKSRKPYSEDANLCFKIVKCANTATGTCATAGTTIAVDPKVVPLTSSVNIASTGNRTAEDTGGAIDGYDIDVFRGTGKAAMKGFGSHESAVRYLSGGGSCN